MAIYKTRWFDRWARKQGVAWQVFVLPSAR